METYGYSLFEVGKLMDPLDRNYDSGGEGLKGLNSRGSGKFSRRGAGAQGRRGAGARRGEEINS